MKTSQERDEPGTGLPAELEAVALVDARTCAAAGAVSVSWWFGEVRNGRAPAPVMRGSRCTRWRLSDVREFWRKRAEESAASDVTAALIQSRAEKASARARQLRAVNKAAAPVAQ